MVNFILIELGVHSLRTGGDKRAVFLIIKRLESPRPKGRDKKDHSISLKVADPTASMPCLHANGKHNFSGTGV